MHDADNPSADDHTEARQNFRGKLWHRRQRHHLPTDMERISNKKNTSNEKQKPRNVTQRRHKKYPIPSKCAAKQVHLYAKYRLTSTRADGRNTHLSVICNKRSLSPAFLQQGQTTTPCITPRPPITVRNCSLAGSTQVYSPLSLIFRYEINTILIP